MNFTEALSYLNSFVNFETRLHQVQSDQFTLARIEKLLDLLGRPDKNLQIIHVAGTKGKGSTCAFIASCLQQAGYKVGLYTSPHLHHVQERIRILDQSNVHSRDDFSGSISDDDFAQALVTMRPHLAYIQNEGYTLTYFEVLTVAAIVHFSSKGVEFVVLETGLGGRLDATNVMDSLIAVITPISFDHMAILGNTLTKIAQEKAGIIKRTSQKVVIAPQDKEAMDVILRRCQEFGIVPRLVFPDQYEGIEPSLKGKHQLCNAAVALDVINLMKSMGVHVSQGAVQEGLKRVRWSGRFQLIRQNPDVVVDCAHNAASAKALAQTILDVYPFRRVILVLGVSQDKDIASICKHLKDSASFIILTKANHPRSHVFTQEEAKDYFGSKLFEIIEDTSSALAQVLDQAKEDDVVIVTGSVFLVAQAIGELCTNLKV